MVIIKSIEALLDHASRNYFAKPRGTWVFRGHSDVSYALVPSVGRGAHTSRSRTNYERSLFETFRREAHGYLPSAQMTEWELLALAQHHGLPTRLLDWTHNLLAALYFSVISKPESDGRVFALNAAVTARESIPEATPFEITDPVKYYPNIVTPRIRAQEGLFIACAKIETALDQALHSSWSIEFLDVPAARKAELRYALFRVGVHASSLFPDIDGLAARIAWQHSISSPFGKSLP